MGLDVAREIGLCFLVRRNIAGAAHDFAAPADRFLNHLVDAALALDDEVANLAHWLARILRLVRERFGVRRHLGGR